MDFEKAIEEVAAAYASKGYNVIARPKPEDLPPFAKRFKVEVLGKQPDIGVLVSVRKNRDEFSADPDMQRYAEITSAQPGWRFDFVLLEGSGIRKKVEGAQEPSEEQIVKSLTGAQELHRAGFLFPAITTAWAAFEAAMRMSVRASGQPAGWGASPHQLLNELLSSGLISTEDFSRLQDVSHLRNQVVHGFSPPNVDDGSVDFLVDVAHRLIREAGAAKQPS